MVSGWQVYKVIRLLTGIKSVKLNLNRPWMTIAITFEWNNLCRQNIPMNYSGFCRQLFLYLTLNRPSNGLNDLCNESLAKTNYGFELRDLKNIPMNFSRIFSTLVARRPKLPLFWGLFFIDNFFLRVYRFFDIRF